MRLAMSAFKVHIKDLRMTGRAVHRLVGGAGALQMVGDLGMTLGTLDILVHRIGQLAIIPEQGNGVAIDYFMQLFILVALHTGLVRDPGLNLGHIHNMRWVTGGTGRNDVWILFPQFSFDHFLVGLLQFVYGISYRYRQSC